MATKAELVSQNVLQLIELEDVPNRHRKRELFGLASLIRWLDEDLEGLEGDWGDSTPVEQLFALFEAFITGKPLRMERQLHVLKPDGKGIWQLKTPDLRVFGWFLERNCFVGVSAGLADQIKTHSLYPSYRDAAAERRDGLGLPQPNFVSGVRYQDVLSDAHD